MTNNDILRRIRYTFDLNDSKMIAIFAQAELEVTRAQISNWLKKEDDPDYQNCTDSMLATFLNGFINEKRGKKEGEQPVPERRLSNNIIFTNLSQIQISNITLSLHSLDNRLRHFLPPNLIHATLTHIHDGIRIYPTRTINALFHHLPNSLPTFLFKYL